MEILAFPVDNSSGGFVKWLKNKLKERSLKEKKAISEAMVNMEVATHVFSNLTSGSIIVNKISLCRAPMFMIVNFLLKHSSKKKAVAHQSCHNTFIIL